VTSLLPRSKDVYPDEVSLVRLHGAAGLNCSASGRTMRSSSTWARRHHRT
jgi:hypothetical protein